MPVDELPGAPVVGSVVFGPDHTGVERVTVGQDGRVRVDGRIVPPAMMPIPEGLEPAAVAANRGSLSDTALVSIAISLRRLADALSMEPTELRK